MYSKPKIPSTYVCRTHSPQSKKYTNPTSHLYYYTFFLHGYADGRHRTATNPRCNILTLIFEPIFELSGLFQLRNESSPTSLLLDFHMHQLANWNENISLPHLLMGAQPRLLYHSIPTTTERNASLKSGFQHLIPPFLQSVYTQQLTCTIPC